ncbi:MAG: TetR/AcrR family transcriptional regulator, partial [Cyclobacteriaceae bacterium]|nr:TetR/AcrR family transcriptional regulator [Cyclobacteriaceae bacterium]
LIEIAKKLFSAQGFSNTSMEEIVQKAGMTSGALYHHFGGKKGLFLAVFKSTLTEIADRISQVEKSKLTIWEKFISCTHEFYEACLDSDLQQIVLIDGPSVLGLDVWRRIDEETTLDILRSHLKELREKGIIKPLPTEQLTHFISGAVNESVLRIAGSKDPKKTFDEEWHAMSDFLNLLKN